MAHGYHTLQHWNHWLAHHALGHRLLAAEKQQLSSMLTRHFGKHTLLLGVPNQADLLKATTIPYHSVLSPLAHKEKLEYYIEGDFQELPLLTGSIDLVMLPHTLEFVSNPRQLLAEACRVIKPEGLIMICGFNPQSLWGIKKLFKRSKSVPWSGNFIWPQLVKKWVQLADFEMEKQTSIMFRPPFNHAALYDKLGILESVGRNCFSSFGGVYILLARAKVIPLTPIRLKWKQQLSGLRISTTISGHIARRN